MSINLVSLYSLICALVCIAILIRLIPPLFKESRRPKDGFSELRNRVFRMPVITLILVGARAPYFAFNLDVPLRGWATSVIGIATSSVILYFVYNMLKSYTFKEDKE